MSPTSSIQNISMVSADSFELIEFIQLTHDVAALNATYLTISVSIILFLGGVFYIFNFKPLQDKLQKQEENIEKDRTENKHQLKKLRKSVKAFKDEAIRQIESTKEALSEEFRSKSSGLEKQMLAIEEKANNEVESIKKETQKNKLESIWSQHYIWSMGSLTVAVNQLTTLIEYLELSNKYKVYVVAGVTCYREIIDALECVKKEYDKYKTLYPDAQRLYDELISAVENTDNFDVNQKKTIQVTAEKILISPETLKKSS